MTTPAPNRPPTPETVITRRVAEHAAISRRARSANAKAVKAHRVRREDWTAKIEALKDARYAAKAFRKFEREYLRDHSLWKPARIRIPHRAPPDLKRRENADRRATRMIAMPVFDVVDRAGRRGVFLKIDFDGAVENRLGVMRRRVLYAALSKDCLLDREGRALLISNVAGDIAEAVVVADEIEAFNRAERKNAKLSINLVIRFPPGSTPLQQEQITRQFCQQAFASHHLPFIANIHQPTRNGKVHNPHAHITMSFRPVVRIGAYNYALGRELRTDLDGPDGMLAMRRILAQVTTKVMRQAGFDHRYTHLSNCARGLPLIPQESLSKGESEAAKRGEYVAKNERNRSLMVAAGRWVLEQVKMGTSNSADRIRAIDAIERVGPILPRIRVPREPIPAALNSLVLPLIKRPLRPSHWVKVNRIESPSTVALSAITSPPPHVVRPASASPRLGLWKPVATSKSVPQNMLGKHEVAVPIRTVGSPVRRPQTPAILVKPAALETRSRRDRLPNVSRIDVPTSRYVRPRVGSSPIAPKMGTRLCLPSVPQADIPSVVASYALIMKTAQTLELALRNVSKARLSTAVFSQVPRLPKAPLAAEAKKNVAHAARISGEKLRAQKFPLRVPVFTGVRHFDSRRSTFAKPLAKLLTSQHVGDLKIAPVASIRWHQTGPSARITTGHFTPASIGVPSKVSVKQFGEKAVAPIPASVVKLPALAPLKRFITAPIPVLPTPSVGDSERWQPRQRLGTAVPSGQGMNALKEKVTRVLSHAEADEFLQRLERNRPPLAIKDGIIEPVDKRVFDDAELDWMRRNALTMLRLHFVQQQAQDAAEKSKEEVKRQIRVRKLAAKANQSMRKDQSEGTGYGAEQGEASVSPPAEALDKKRADNPPLNVNLGINTYDQRAQNSTSPPQSSTSRDVATRAADAAAMAATLAGRGR